MGDSARRSGEMMSHFLTPFALSLSKPVLSACKAVEGGRPFLLTSTRKISPSTSHGQTVLIIGVALSPVAPCNPPSSWPPGRPSPRRPSCATLPPPTPSHPAPPTQ